jgi:lipoyl-dependent peroxiredoxin
VSIGSIENGAFGLVVDISEVSIEEAQRLTEKSHRVWSNSNKLTATNN